MQISAYQSLMISSTTYTGYSSNASSTGQEASSGAAQASADTIDIASMSLDDAQALLYGRLDESIRAVLSVDDVVPSLDPSDWSAEAVAGRILNFAEQFLKATTSEEEYASVLAEVEEGIAAGLAQAKDILEGLDRLNGDVAENISATESLLYQGIDTFKSMASQLFTSAGDSSSIDQTV